MYANFIAIKQARISPGLISKQNPSWKVNKWKIYTGKIPKESRCTNFNIQRGKETSGQK